MNQINPGVEGSNLVRLNKLDPGFEGSNPCRVNKDDTLAVTYLILSVSLLDPNFQMPSLPNFQMANDQCLSNKISNFPLVFEDDLAARV